MSWHAIRSFGKNDYKAYRRFWDSDNRSFCLQSSTCAALTLEMRKKNKWYVAGWKIHLSLYPADYTKALPALRLFEDRVAFTNLVYKYAASRRLYEKFEGEVKGKFATIYCRAPSEVPTVIRLINQMFTQEGITPVSPSRINHLEGLRHELPLVGGYGFVRYGAFCYTNGILDLTDPDREPMRDSRRRPFPRFKDPALMAGEIEIFKSFLHTSSQYRANLK